MDRILRQSSRAAGIDEGLALFFPFAPSGSARRVDRDHQQGVFSAHGRAGDRERLNSAQIANARMNDMPGAWPHARLKRRKRGWRSIRASEASLCCCRRRAGRVHAADGSSPRTRRAHNRNPRRTRLSRSVDCPVAHSACGLIYLARTMNPTTDFAGFALAYHRSASWLRSFPVLDFSIGSSLPIGRRVPRFALCSKA
jgi:hypothetical protein